MKKRKMFRGLANVITVVLTVAMLFPILWIMLNSFKPGPEIFAQPITLLPEHFTLEAYTKYLVSNHVFRGYLNSFLVAMGALATGLGLGVASAYGLARYAIWYKRTYDYFHMPLFVRPGSILPVGNVETTPVYDYEKGVTFKLYEIPESFRGECRIFDTSGRETLGLWVRRDGKRLSLSVKGNASEAGVLLAGVRDIRTDGTVHWEEEEEGVRLEGGRGKLECELL